MKYEWRETLVRKGPPILSDTATGNAQFRSVYGFPPVTEKLIVAQKHMKNLDGKMLYSDTLLIDIDKQEHVAKAKSLLRELGIGYEVWTTGNRGCHVHIPIQPMVGVNVIYSQKHWLKSVGLWDLIDTTIYRPAGQFRAAGAVHRTTKEIKRRLSVQQGRLLEIRMLAPPPIVHTDWELEETSPTKLFDFFMNLLARRDMGGRHMHMYILFKSGQKAGLPREEIEDCIRWWNQTMAEVPHRDDAVERKLRGFK